MTGNQLREAIRKSGITQDKAAESLGITRRTLQNWFNLEKLDANISQNVKCNLDIDFEYYDDTDVVLKESQTYYGGEDFETPTFVPLLPISAQGGSLNDFLVSVKDSDCERVVSPIKGADFAMTVAGDSMSPEYPSGSQILIKKINERAFIDWGKVYVLDTCNGSVIKRIFPTDNKDPDKVKCVSINPDYPPFEVSLENVFGVYRVLLSMSVK